MLFAKSVSEYERILSFTILGIKKPLVVNLAQRLITVLFVTPALRKILCKKKSNQTLPVNRADREILLLIALFPEWERGMRASA